MTTIDDKDRMKPGEIRKMAKDIFRDKPPNPDRDPDADEPGPGESEPGPTQTEFVIRQAENGYTFRTRNPRNKGGKIEAGLAGDDGDKTHVFSDPDTLAEHVRTVLRNHSADR